MAEEMKIQQAPPRQWGNLAGAGLVGLVLGAIIVALVFYQPARRDLTATQERVAAYADSTATARVSADSLRAELATVSAERDSFKTWYNEAVEMLSSQGQVPAAMAAAETEVTGDWESLGR